MTAVTEQLAAVPDTDIAAMAVSIASLMPKGPAPDVKIASGGSDAGRVFPKHLYKLRARIEQTIGKLKRFKRIAMRCEKTDASYSAFISFACGLMLVKTVHMA